MKKNALLGVVFILALGITACNTGAVRSYGTPDYQFQAHHTQDAPRKTYPTTYTTQTTTYESNYDVNNSKVNARIAKNAEWTAEDQGSSEYDIKTTQAIRRQLVERDTFSTSAKNVKVITRDGFVVLKGPVKSLEERRRIEEIAKSVAGTTHVTNAITVK